MQQISVDGVISSLEQQMAFECTRLKQKVELYNILCVAFTQIWIRL